MCIFYVYLVNTCTQYNKRKASPSELNEHTFFIAETLLSLMLSRKVINTSVWGEIGVPICFTENNGSYNVEIARHQRGHHRRTSTKRKRTRTRKRKATISKASSFRWISSSSSSFIMCSYMGWQWWNWTMSAAKLSVSHFTFVLRQTNKTKQKTEYIFCKNHNNLSNFKCIVSFVCASFHLNLEPVLNRVSKGLKKWL